VALEVEPEDATEGVTLAERAWKAALSTRYGIDSGTALTLVRVSPEQFDIGFAAAVEHRSTRPPG
jgi:hypothetical protein